jgi:hypothetical protein
LCLLTLFANGADLAPGCMLCRAVLCCAELGGDAEHCLRCTFLTVCVYMCLYLAVLGRCKAKLTTAASSTKEDRRLRRQETKWTPGPTDCFRPTQQQQQQQGCCRVTLRQCCWRACSEATASQSHRQPH